MRTELYVAIAVTGALLLCRPVDAQPMPTASPSSSTAPTSSTLTAPPTAPPSAPQSVPPPPAYPYYAPYYAPYPPPPWLWQPLPPPCDARCQKLRAGERARLFSVGGHATVLSVNQQLGGERLTMWGGGLEFRYRTHGHFGLSAVLDYVHGSSGYNGGVERDSLPASLSALVYLFTNRDARHFNLYFIGGLGVIGTTMTLHDDQGRRVKQDFTEFEAHLGVGAELRFKWLAIEAEARGVSLWRDDSEQPAAYYTDTGDGPVPRSSQGIQGALGAMFWF